MIDNGSERRNFARERTNLPVTVTSGMRKIQATVEYLGFGGAFVKAPKTFLEDSVVELEIDLPGQATSFRGSARVVWIHKNKAMGLQFQDLPSSERLKLEQFLLSS